MPTPCSANSVLDREIEFDMRTFLGKGPCVDPAGFRVPAVQAEVLQQDHNEARTAIP